MLMQMSEIFSRMLSRFPGFRPVVYITLLPLSPWSKYRSPNWVYLLPKALAPVQKEDLGPQVIQAVPGTGVPVTPPSGRYAPFTLASALNLLDLWLFEMLLSPRPTACRTARRSGNSLPAMPHSPG